MPDKKTENQQLALSVIDDLLENYKTASLATCSENGTPQVSYAPVAVDARRRFYIFVSELSAHTANLRRSGLVSMLLMVDESSCEQIFARNRLVVEGQVSEIARHSGEWEEATATYRQRFGKFFDRLATLNDFHLLKIEPRSARIIVGFGAAYDIDLPDWQNLNLVGPD